MTIRAQLAGGDPRSLGNTEAVVTATLADQALLPELFACLFVSDEVVRMRAGDALEKVCRQHPDWLAPYTTRLLNDAPTIRQPSVQWHLAQMLAELSLTEPETERAVEILQHNLASMDDWIVTNFSLESLATFTRARAFDRSAFVQILEEQTRSRHKSVAKRAGKLMSEFGAVPSDR